LSRFKDGSKADTIENPEFKLTIQDISRLKKNLSVEDFDDFMAKN